MTCPSRLETGVSLGTVQKGLGKLVADRRIQREHGRGTFVRAGLLPMTDMWHYRFRHPETGLLLPVFAHLTERVQVVGDPTVREALGDDKTGYVRVCRIINIDDRFRCWSEIPKIEDVKLAAQGIALSLCRAIDERASVM